MAVKTILLDLDGVLCHSDKYHYEAWKSAADELRSRGLKLAVSSSSKNAMLILDQLGLDRADRNRRRP